MPSPQNLSENPPAECATGAELRVACFSVHGAAAPGLLLRVLEQWAKRGLVPARVHAVVCGPTGNKQSIDLEACGINVGMSLQIADALRCIWGVEQVLVAEK